MSDELKPCPFCGGEPALIHPDEEWDAVVVCEKCGAVITKDSDAEAIFAWNARAVITNEQFVDAVRCWAFSSMEGCDEPEYTMLYNIVANIDEYREEVAYGHAVE